MSLCSVAESVTECYLTNANAGKGIVVTPDGTNYWRIRVDNDGTPVSEALTVAPDPTQDFVWTKKKTGPVFNPGGISDVADPMYRLRVDVDGTIVSEGFNLSGWVVARPVTGYSFSSDVLIQGQILGVVLTTPDGSTQYRLRMDSDGAIISEELTD